MYFKTLTLEEMLPGMLFVVTPTMSWFMIGSRIIIPNGETVKYNEAVYIDIRKYGTKMTFTFVKKVFDTHWVKAQHKYVHKIS